MKLGSFEISQINKEKRAELEAAIASHDFLCALVREIETQHKLVFHAVSALDWDRVHKSAEQILIAEIMTRHAGNIQGIYTVIESLQRHGREWAAAIRELASRIHSYFTTPLGIMLRVDLFDRDAVFISPDADRYFDAKAVAAPESKSALQS
ncbi:MAG: hypothetical protein AB7N71_07520 [Phycisphaerae bacterium]